MTAPFDCAHLLVLELEFAYEYGVDLQVSRDRRNLVQIQLLCHDLENVFFISESFRDRL